MKMKGSEIRSIKKGNYSIDSLLHSSKVEIVSGKKSSKVNKEIRPTSTHKSSSKAIISSSDTKSNVSDYEKLKFYGAMCKFANNENSEKTIKSYNDRDKQILKDVVSSHERMQLAEKLLRDKKNTTELSTECERIPINVPKSQLSETRFVSLDCEMVGVGPRGRFSEIGRVSIVGFNGEVLMDEYGKPFRSVSDYRSRFSGIFPYHLVNASSSSDVMQRARNLLRDKIIVGHDLSHDLKVLNIDPRSVFTRDTSMFEPYVRIFGRKPSLKALALLVLGLRIQLGPHNSVEDARIAMTLYKVVRYSWESLGLGAVIQDSTNRKRKDRTKNNH